MPTVPDRIPLVKIQWWEETREAFETERAKQADVYAASSQLVFDGFLYLVGYYDPDAGWLRANLQYDEDKTDEHIQAATKSRELFVHLADLTRHRDDAPLRIAHCIRDLSYGDTSRASDLEAMIKSSDPPYREIFERSYWR